MCMKHPPLFILVLAFLFAVFGAYGAQAKPQAVDYNGRTYYVVISADATENTGNEVCAKAGKRCIGYTGFTNDICKQVHPDAVGVESEDGSKAGFYCDGPPQKGACDGAQNECRVCPACDVNADCSTEIGDQFREMYAECREVIEIAYEPPSFWGKVFDHIASPVGRLIGFLKTLKVKQ